MPQDFSGQKLYGRSFVKQDLQQAKNTLQSLVIYTIEKLNEYSNC